MDRHPKSTALESGGRTAKVGYELKRPRRDVEDRADEDPNKLFLLVDAHFANKALQEVGAKLQGTKKEVNDLTAAPEELYFFISSGTADFFSLADGVS